MKMRKFIAMLLLVAMLAASTAFATNAVLKGNAHLYKGAGTYKTETVLQKGSVVKLTYDHIGSKNTKITLSNGEKWWIKSKYIKGTTTKAVNEVYAAGGTGKAKAGTKIEKETKKTWVVLRNKINIRTKPGLDGKPLSPSLKKGWKLKGLGKKSTDSRGQVWHLVSYKGVEGWVSEGKIK